MIYSKNILIIISGILFIALSMKSVDAQEWRDGDGGKVKWQYDCDFPGYDMKREQIPGEQCGSLCLNTNGCSHFSHFDGFCYVKKAPTGMARQQKSGCVCGFPTSSAVAQEWRDGDGGKVKWQSDCDFPGYDMKREQIPAENCGSLCINTNGCSHFSHFDGFCYVKKAPSGMARQQKSGCVCGYLTGNGPIGGSKVKGTFWAEQSDAGGCQMPQGDYAVTDAIALGQSQELGNLKWRQGLCGQVLRVDCGNGAIEAVVASTCNLNSGTCGVDMIGKTWRKATSNKPPGIVDCSVSLTNRNPLRGNDPLCYYRPNSENNNNYYAILGVVNTGGRISSSAVASGVTGRRNNDGWFEFNGSGKPLFTKDAQVVFRYEDGSSTSFRLSDCRIAGQVQIFQ